MNLGVAQKKTGIITLVTPMPSPSTGAATSWLCVQGGWRRLGGAPCLAATATTAPGNFQPTDCLPSKPGAHSNSAARCGSAAASRLQHCTCAAQRPISTSSLCFADKARYCAPGMSMGYELMMHECILRINLRNADPHHRPQLGWRYAVAPASRAGTPRCCRTPLHAAAGCGSRHCRLSCCASMPPQARCTPPKAGAAAAAAAQRFNPAAAPGASRRRLQRHRWVRAE